MPAEIDQLEAFKAAQRAGWAFFAPLQAVTTIPAARLVKFAGLGAGQRVLDVACGTGVVAITAARAGAEVTALDLTPELLEAARANAAIAGVNVRWHEGDVEKLPFESGSFDAVVSQFGHMFAPRPELAVSEMLRVLKPGGTIAFSTWPPEMFIGRVFGLTARYAPPPPPGIAPPPLWGEPQVIRERLGTAVRDLQFARYAYSPPALSPRHQRELTERTAGPMVKLVAALGAQDPERLAAFQREHEAIVAAYFEDNSVRHDFLMTRAVKA